MPPRTPVWGGGGGQQASSYSPIRCLLCLGFDLTLWDVARLVPCITWSCMALVCACLFLQYPIVHNRPAHLLPMLGAIQSAMPAFMCAALLLMYHRQRVLVLGLPRETAAAFAGFYCIASTVGCFVYLVFLLTTVFVFQVDRTEEPGYFFLSSTWLLVTLLWFILQSCLKPSNKQIDQLIRNYENSQLPFAYPAAPAGVVVGAPVAVGGAPLGGAPPQAGGSGGPLQNSSYAAASQRREGSPGAPPQGATEMTTAAEAEPVVLGNVRS